MTAQRETVVWSWLHLSDIHFGHGAAENVSDQSFVLDALAHDLPSHMTHAVNPQAVLITGDVGFSGGARDPAEYESALKYLNRIQQAIGDVPVYVVPGNHDVQRTVANHGGTARLLKALRSGGPGEFDECMTHSDEADLLHARFSHYDEFVANAGANGDSQGWVHDITYDAWNIRLLGWNTALLSNDDYDEGKLAIHHSAVDSALVSAPPSAIVVALSHHPTSWLSAKDRKRLEERMPGKVHIHLHGHVHDPASRSVRDGQGRSSVVITAGAAHGERQGFEPSVPFHYSIGAIVATRDALELRVWPRRWSKDRWVLDVDTVPDRQTYAVHRIRSRRAPAARAEAATDAETEEPHPGVALLDRDDRPLHAVASEIGPQLIAAEAVHGRIPALMSADGRLLACDVGGSLRLAWTDQQAAGCTSWGAPVPLEAEERVLAIAPSGVGDVLLVTASSTGTRLRLASPSVPVRDVTQLDARPARVAGLLDGRILLAWHREGRTTCDAFPGIEDLREIHVASSGGSSLVLGLGGDGHGNRQTYVLHGDRIRDLGQDPTPVIAIPRGGDEPPMLMRMPEYEHVLTPSDADRVYDRGTSWRSLRFGES